MSPIILSTLNARYAHASLGLRYLYANMGDRQPETSIVEFEVNRDSREIVESLLRLTPKIIGFGVYIWNVAKTEEVISLLKKVAPEVVIIVGGPEVSFETNSLSIAERVDYVVTGEADLAFAQLCEALLAGARPADQIIRSPLPPLDKVQLPYRHYSDTDLRHRIIYVEVSRGCPFTCEFCLSSLDIPVRSFLFDSVLSEIDLLIQRGARSFKFVDRTFNLNLRTARTILQFFLDRIGLGLFLHFEMVPDRFPEPLRDIVARFPPGALQFEVGIQSFNPEVCATISRRQDFEALERNLRFLIGETGVYIHADLIAGLPGEDLKSFARGFDRLVGLGPHEIQVGILKRLKGTPIIRHDQNFAMNYGEFPPYEVVSTSCLSFSELQAIKRFAKIWDLVGNSRNFTRILPILMRTKGSPFASVWALTEWVTGRYPQAAGIGISLKALTTAIFDYLADSLEDKLEEIGRLLAADYGSGGRTDLPDCLRPWRKQQGELAHPAAQRGRERQQREFATRTLQHDSVVK